MKWIGLFEEFREFKLKKDKELEVHNLSGIALIVDNKILLVHPRKHKRFNDKWSIPKGHIEGQESLNSALKEIEEESGIKLGDNYTTTFKLEYDKSGAHKFLDVYVYVLSKNDITKYLGDGWEIRKKWFNKEEIWRCKFFDMDRARDKIELEMMDIIDEIEKTNLVKKSPES